MKISVITTTYNSEATIRDTMRSVLEQSHADVEYIIVDGGSTDGTLDVIKELEPLFKGRLIWKSEPDHGIYDAMNKGIRMATGDIVGTLNSDDFFTSKDILQHVSEALSHNDIDAVYGDVHFVRPDSLAKTMRYYSSRLFRPCWLRFGFMPAHPSFYVRREVYQKAGGYALDYKIAADFDMMVRLFHRYKIKARYINKDFVTMRTGGISTKNNKNRALIARENVRACRRYGLYTNIFFVSMKYFYKVFELR